MKFHDRNQAGEQLGQVLQDQPNPLPVVIGLARGGVVVAAPVARLLHAPLDMGVSRKISHPLMPEYALGAITDTGEAVWGDAVESTTRSWRLKRAEDIQRFAQHMRRRYLEDREPVLLVGRTAIIVDDGIATGLTMMAAVRDVRSRGPHRIVVAVPVSAHEARSQIEAEVDDLVSLCEPVRSFQAVGEFYEDFDQVTDEEVRQLLGSYQSARTSVMPIDLPSLNSVLAAIKSYPTSSETIARQARRLHAPASVVGFFESIPGGTTFRNKADVVNRSLSAEMLEEQSLTEPDERPTPDD